MRIIERLIDKSPVRLEDVAGVELDCPCGRRHVMAIDALVNRPGSVMEVGEFLSQRGYRRAWLIADERTYGAAGSQVEKSCRAAGVDVKKSVLPGDPPPHADRDALGRLAFDLETPALPIIAVGSGTITDVARFLAYRMGTSFVVVPTAPSMDGYTSSVAAMVVDGVRVTYPATSPRAIFADPDIYSGAPAEFIAAGYAEILGKLTALADWRLSSVFNGEYLCPLAEELVIDAVRPVLADPSSPSTLMDALLWIGVAMNMMGNSRPASGAEHHLAHYWEMRALWEGREPQSHGARAWGSRRSSSRKCIESSLCAAGRACRRSLPGPKGSSTPRKMRSGRGTAPWPAGSWRSKLDGKAATTEPGLWTREPSKKPLKPSNLIS